MSTGAEAFPALRDSVGDIRGLEAHVYTTVYQSTLSPNITGLTHGKESKWELGLLYLGPWPLGQGSSDVTPPVDAVKMQTDLQV